MIQRSCGVCVIRIYSSQENVSASNESDIRLYKRWLINCNWLIVGDMIAYRQLIKIVFVLEIETDLADRQIER